MTDFFADLEAHLLTAARRERRPRWRPRVVLAVAGAAAAAALAIAVLPLPSEQRGAVGGGPPPERDGWTSYAPLGGCEDPAAGVTGDPPSQRLRDAFEVFRRPRLAALPGDVVATLARAGAAGIHRAAAREARGPDYSRLWIVPVESIANPQDCDDRSGPAVCTVPSDGNGHSCAVEESFIRTGITRLFTDVERRKVVVGLVPDGVAGVLMRVGGEQVELSVRRNNFAATLDPEASEGTIPDGADVDGVEDLDLHWRYRDGRVVPAF